MTPPNNLPFAPEPTDEELESLAAAPQIVTPPRPPSPVAAPVASVPSAPPEPEDMFADSAPVQAAPRMVATPVMSQVPSSHGPSMGKIAALVLVLVVLLGGAGYGVYRFMSSSEDEVVVTPTSTQVAKKPSIPTVPTTPSNSITQPSATETSATPITLPPPITTPPEGVQIPLPSTSTPVVTPAPSVSSPIDTDKDGLTDPQEVELGLDPNKADTDGDGLMDADENKIYGTNPLKADTDGDTFSDGQEVKNGYNPRGAGKCSTPDCKPPLLQP